VHKISEKKLFWGNEISEKNFFGESSLKIITQQFIVRQIFKNKKRNHVDWEKFFFQVLVK